MKYHVETSLKSLVLISLTGIATAEAVVHNHNMTAPNTIKTSQKDLHTSLIQSKQAPKRYIVHYRSANALSRQKSALNLVTTSTDRPFVLSTLAKLNALVVEATPEAKAQLAANPDVLLIEEDPERYLLGQTTPYGVTQLQGLSTSEQYVSNTPVCIIDSGVDITHEDMPTNITGEVVDRLTQQVNLGQWSTDAYGHGTHVSGIIAGLDNNTGVKGVVGSGQANIHHVKVIHNPNYWRMWGSDLIDAIDACQQAGAKVINMSIGGNAPSVAEELAMQSAYQSGTLLVSSAGNFGSSSLVYPASYNSVISVGAINSLENAWQFTQSNEQVELVAAGQNVRSTIPNNSYREWDGTSMAAAHVTGATALIWSYSPQCSAERIRNVINLTAKDLGVTGKDNTYGNGLPQINAAISYLQNNGCSEPSAPILTFHDSLNSFDPQSETNVFEDFENFLPAVTPTMTTVKKGISYEYVSHRPEDNGFAIMNPGNKVISQTELDMTSKTLTGNGEDDFIIYPPANTFSIGFETYVSRYGPIQIEVETVSGHTATYSHYHTYTQMGFVGVTSTEAIKSVYFNGHINKAINTGIDNLRLTTQ